MSTAVGGNTSTIAQDIAYLPFGGVKSYTLGNGVAVTRTYDTDYRLQDIADMGGSAVQHLDLAYDRRGNVTLRDDLLASIAQTFAYDEVSRLTSASGAYGTQGFTYDDVGNRLTQTGTTPDTYNYSGASHQLNSLGSGTNFTYDDAGNVMAKGALSLTYNEANRLATASVGGVTVTNTYGANGQRVRKLASGVTTVYQYDRSGQLIAETPDSGTGREYVWLDSIPLAQASAAGLAYFHVDQLNTPQKMSDASQAVVWQASYEPFGTASVTTSGGYDNPLRFPGQYFDSETGLHQNWNRDYDPSIGRYLQSDPVGLRAGLSTYGYVGMNPLGATDRLGLTADNDYRDIPVPNLGPVTFGATGCIGTACLSSTWNGGDANLSLVYPFELGGSLNFCTRPKDDPCTDSRPPLPPPCKGPICYPDTGRRTTGVGLGRHLGLSFNNDGSVCINIGLSIATPVTYSIETGPLIK